VARDHRYWIYMMASVTGALYIGVTSRLYGRVWDHKTKRVQGHTAKYNESNLVYFEEYQYINTAIAREKELKGWRREKKTALINETNPYWDDLAADWNEADDLAAAMAANEQRDPSFVGMTKDGPTLIEGSCLEQANEERPALFSIGHSNQSMEEFVRLLRQHGIEVLVDVRSAPYSRYVPHFSQASLREAIVAAGLRYVYLGKELGGRPVDIAFYDSDGRADYQMISETPSFRDGIERLRRGAQRFRVTIMCSEEDPTHCHRRLLVSRVLESEGVLVRHIRGDGHVDLENDLRDTPVDQPQQATLFGEDVTRRGPPEWKSTRSVLPRSPRDSSSES
jgi:predicted GIY-YIG superfamily endonuclease